MAAAAAALGVFSKCFHYSTCLSSIFSISFHISTYLSSIFSTSFHYSTDFLKIWKKGKSNSDKI
jgi:hypothetical protein